MCLRYFNAYGDRMNDVGAYRSVISVFKEQTKAKIDINIVNDGEQKIFFNTGGMYDQHPMIYKMEDNETDDIIEKIKNNYA